MGKDRDKDKDKELTSKNEMKLSQEFYKKAQELFKDYPKRVHALLPLLHMIQKEQGQISDQAMEEVADLVDVAITHVQGVVTFYTMYSLKKRAPNYIGVCTNLSCWLRGSKELSQSLLKMIDEEKDFKGKFHLEETECLGACDHAPVALCNEKYMEDANLDDLKDWCLAKCSKDK
ncbi:MAG: NAD(P)H-dependent oxidoreductase subunit E [SAR324 cluster bacterium]|nr:NAD(P)H-dependent oxidoreductase subunit E [SAR324 cluster bacterium]